MLIKPPDNPCKELAALDALRRAKLGTLYGKFWIAPGVRWPSEFNDEGLWEPLPPKKPAESVRFAREEEWLKNASGAGLTIPHRFEHVEPFAMAATGTAYRKTPQSTSENIAASSPFDLLGKARASALHPRERSVLVAMLEEGNRFAKRETSNQIFTAALTVADAVGYPTITVRRSIARLKAQGVLHLVYHENWIDERGKVRRPRTYQVNEEKLEPRPTIKECRKMRAFNRQKLRHAPKVQEISSSSPAPAQEPAAPAPPSSPAAAPVREVDSHRSSASAITRGEDRVRKLRLEVMAKWAELKRGCNSFVGLDGLRIRIGPEHPDYRPSLSPEKAWDVALSRCGVTEREAREKLKISLGDFEQEEQI